MEAGNRTAQPQWTTPVAGLPEQFVARIKGLTAGDPQFRATAAESGRQ